MGGAQTQLDSAGRIERTGIKMTEPHTIGILGAGMWGRVLADRFGQDRRARVTWMNSTTEASARAAAQECGVERWTTAYREVLADPSVEAVAIATPPYLHAQQLVEALQAGKHVLVEKPLAESRESMQQILQAAAAHPQQVVLDASARHARLSPKFRFIKALVDSGKLGQVYHIHHNHLSRGTFIEYNPKGAWAQNRALAGGGPFIDWGVYDLSFHLGLLDDRPELLSVRSFARNDLRDMTKWVAFSDVEQHGAAWLEFSGGLSYYYERGAGVHAETPNETRLYGTRGGLRFQFPTWDSNAVEFFSCDDGEPRRETLQVDTAGAPEDALALTTHFLDCLEGSTAPLMPVALAAKHLEILFRILE
jgi:predicted dehydrogenase